MDIDLFLSPYGECGLLCNGEFDQTPAGTLFDAETLEITIEFLEEEPFHLNITVEEELCDRILLARTLYIGFLREGQIADTIETPLLYLNDPYGSDLSGTAKLRQATRSMVAFEQFMKRTNFAQPIHRDDLGDESASGSVLRGMDPKQLEYVPQLVRQRLMELAPQAPGPDAPMPSGLTPMGPGGTRSGSTAQRRPPLSRPPTDDSSDK